MKTCSKCGEEKPLEEFSKNRSRNDGLHPQCRVCHRATQRRYKSANGRDLYLRRYGLTAKRWADMLAAQGARCAICRSPSPGGSGTWQIDHDHTCCPAGRSCGACVRGLLCLTCNTGLGFFRDSERVLLSAADYLRSSRLA